MHASLLLTGLPGPLVASACFWTLAKCFSKAFCLLLASFSDADEIDREVEALDLVDGPLDVNFALLGSEASDPCCLGEEAAKLLE